MRFALQEKAWGYVKTTFPVRQVYIRSEGRVQFFTFSPMLQAVCAGSSLLVLSWLAFASVNVIFKDRIIVAKERHFEQMQSSYESRLAELQLSYDELNGALVSAEDRFKVAAETLEAKQRTVAQLLEQKANLRASLTGNEGIRHALAGPTAIQTASNDFGVGVGGAPDEVTAPSSVAEYAPSYARVAPVLPVRTSGPSSAIPTASLPVSKIGRAHV